MKRLALLLLFVLLLSGCTQPQKSVAPPAALPAPPAQPEPAARPARDFVMRPLETGSFAWQPDSGGLCSYDPPGAGGGAWWVHTADLALPGLEGASVRFCQWRGDSIMQRWAVHARVDRGVTHLYAGPRLGDELNWYDVVTMPDRPGFALVAGLINHAGQREWAATAAVIPFEAGFGELKTVGAGIFGATALGPDRTRLFAWQGQHASGMEGLVINCILCPQHMTVTEYTWGEHWEPRPGPERRTRLLYPLGSTEAVRELPVRPRAQEIYNQGMALIAAGDPEKARSVFAAAFGLDPTFADAAAGEGYSYILQQRWTEALLPLEQALRVDGLHPGARFNMALALSRLGRYKEAREHAIHALLLQPGRDEPRALYEEIRRAMGS